MSFSKPEKLDPGRQRLFGCVSDLRLPQLTLAVVLAAQEEQEEIPKQGKTSGVMQLALSQPMHGA